MVDFMPAISWFQGLLLSLVLMLIMFQAFWFFIWKKNVMGGVMALFISGIGAFIIAAPETALDIARWLLDLIRFGRG